MSGHPRDKGGSNGSGGLGSPMSQKLPPPKEIPGKRREMRADFLLNFQRPPAHQRPAPTSSSSHRVNQHRASGGNHGGGRRGGGGYATAYTKGRFVQNSFRLFVEEISQDVVDAAYSADSLLDWANVRRVDLLCEERPKCPICLEEEMVVPKITRCGHVYCLPCVMRYVMILQEYNGKVWQRCPVCNEPVAPEDLTSVRLQLVRQLSEGDSLTFVLAHRERDATTVRVGPMAAEEGNSDYESGGGGGGRNDTTSAQIACLSLPREQDHGWHLGRLLRLAPSEVDRLLAQEVDALRQYRPAAISAGDTELLPSIDASIESLKQRQLGRGGASRANLSNSASSREHPSPSYWGFRYVEVPQNFPEHGSWAFSRNSGRARGPYGGTAAFSADKPSANGGGCGDADVQHYLPPAAVANGSEEAEHDRGELEDTSHAARSVRHGDAADAQATGAGAWGDGDVSGTAGSCATSPAATPMSGPVASPLVACADTQAVRRVPYTAGAPKGAISFYQLADGRLVFLQPFFTRLILHEHGGRWDALPAALFGLRLERFQEVTIWEETRRRHRFLSHLPLGSSVVFAEIDLRGRLSRDTLDKFSDEFAKRRQQQKRDQIKERKEERISQSRAAVEEERYYQSFNRMAPSMIQAPPTKDDFAVDLLGRAPAEPTAEWDQEPGGSDGDGAGNGPTLAEKIKEQMAAKAKKASRGRGRGSTSGRGAGDGGYPAALGGTGNGGAAEAAFPELGGGSGGSARGGSSAWGRGRGSSRVAAKAVSNAAAVDSEPHVRDSWEDADWDDDGSPATGGAPTKTITPMDEQPSFGQALEAALLRSVAEGPESEGAAAGASELATDAGAVASVSEAAGKKKKGKSGKATTIRLFG